MSTNSTASQTKPPPDFWTVDHFKSDRNYHYYCNRCYEQIPGFLLRWWQNCGPALVIEGEPATCEGCGLAAQGL